MQLIPLIVMLQVLVLAVTVPLYLTSLNTSRLRKSQHSSLLALAAGVGVLSVLLAMMALASVDEIRSNIALCCTIPALTVIACAIIVRRSIRARRIHRVRR